MNTKFMKSKKYVIVALFVLAALLSVWLSDKVAINYNISDYLDESTETKISLNIIEDEFGKTGDVQVMIENIDTESAKDVVDTIKKIPNVLTVNFDEYDTNYYKDGDALFVVLVDGDEYSDTANAVVEDIRTALDDSFEGKINYGGSVVEKRTMREAIQNEIVFILAIAVCLVIAIMLIMAKSWIEPIILLIASGVAILINMGTNAIFGEISYITNAVAAILQLALSIDYSIVLLHGYRKAKENDVSSEKAMTSAIKDVIKPVSASALTTIAGLLALLFMTMRIGFDIGIVLMKGIIISALTSMTLLPALLLIFEKLMDKTAKRELVLNGKKLCSFAVKGSKAVVPIALALIIACGVLQFGNAYSFTDSKGSNTAIEDVFGSNNSVVVVYPNSNGSFDKESELADKLLTFKTADGKTVLKNYTAYSNTVRELYDIDMAARKLDISKSDVEMLFAMYHLYNGKVDVKFTTLDFVEYADYLTENDVDVQEFSDEEMEKTLRTLLMIDELMDGEHTAEEFHTLATTGVMEGTELDLFAVKQMYGLYLYGTLTDSTVNFETMLDYMIASGANENVADMFDEKTVADLTLLSGGIKQFKAQMEMPLTKEQFQGYMYQNYNAVIDAATATQIYGGYYLALGQQPQETIPFLNLMSFLVSQNQITDPVAVATINEYSTLYATVRTNYPYEQFLPILTQVATALSGEAPTIATSSEAVQQIYIIYFYEQNAFANAELDGRSFVEFVNEAYKTNSIVASQLEGDGKDLLDDMLLADEFLSDTAAYDYKEITEKISALQKEIKSLSTNATISSDKISGVYIKYATANDIIPDTPIMACDLLDFVSEHMNENELLVKKMTEDKREKVDSAKADMADAEELFLGNTYSRMILSVDLPSESEESTRFVEHLTASVKEVFGNDAHVAGEMVSTYDLQKTFDTDNTLISIFTIISIFLIVMLVFRSLSLPVILVAVIQGAIWISMSTSLLTGPMFFMSYIITNCILMGATIDYGILMSTNYVQYRQTLDKKEALARSVEIAIPTVFTSGLILTICGFVVGIISSQTSISTVGFLLGKGTLVSVLMITLVLPSVLYLLDGFILKLSMKKKQ